VGAREGDLVNPQGGDEGRDIDGPKRVGDLFEFSRLLEQDGFIRHFPEPCLVQVGGERSSESGVGFRTMSRSVNPVAIDDELGQRPVYFLRKRAGNAFTMMITVGRALNNDVVIKNGLVSKFHAYFNQCDDTWFVTDADSSNGSYVDGRRLSTGERIEVGNESRISFSEELNYQFLRPGSLFEYLLRVRTG
jgi:hypothetical protein